METLHTGKATSVNWSMVIMCISSYQNSLKKGLFFIQSFYNMYCQIISFQPAIMQAISLFRVMRATAHNENLY